MREIILDFVRGWGEMSQPANLSLLITTLEPELRDSTAEEMEALLSQLPQWGALRGRRPGDLRIASLGFHAHVRGRDPQCPYPVDFFTRLRGAQATVNLVLRFVPGVVRHEIREAFRDVGVGRSLDLIAALRIANAHGIGLRSIDLVMQRMYRPCAPNGFHWGTPGGVHELKEDAVTRGLTELAQEAKGLTVLASRVLLHNQLYQSGNITEAHTLVGLLCVGEPEVSTQALAEGIVEYKTIPVLEAREWLRRECEVSPDDPASMLPDGKISHALNEFLLLCEEVQIL